MSTPSKSAIVSKVSIEGCDEFVHHFDTVEVSLPSLSPSHLPLLPFSIRTALSLFTSLVFILFGCVYVRLYKVIEKISLQR
jgi:hypothetical protein